MDKGRRFAVGARGGALLKSRDPKPPVMQGKEETYGYYQNLQRVQMDKNTLLNIDKLLKQKLA